MERERPQDKSHQRIIQIITVESYVLRTSHLHDHDRRMIALTRLQTIMGRSPELSEEVERIASMDQEVFKDFFHQIFPQKQKET